MKNNIPQIIQFNSIGSVEWGYLSVAEELKNIPFEIKRVFWAYFTPDSITRGGHAHYKTEMLLIAVSGKIVVETEMLNGVKDVFILDRPNTGVFLPKMCWHTMKYSHNAAQLVIASSFFDESDYIRNYNKFLKYGNPNS